MAKELAQLEEGKWEEVVAQLLPHAARIQSPQRRTSTIRFPQGGRSLSGSWKGHHSLAKNGSGIILSVSSIKMGLKIPEMATALGSPLVWATCAILVSKKPKNSHFLPPARSTKIYQGNGLGGSQCLLESPPIISEQRIRKRIWTKAHLKGDVFLEKGSGAWWWLTLLSVHSKSWKKQKKTLHIWDSSPPLWRCKSGFLFTSHAQPRSVTALDPMTEVAEWFQGEQHPLLFVDVLGRQGVQWFLSHCKSLFSNKTFLLKSKSNRRCCNFDLN